MSLCCPVVLLYLLHLVVVVAGATVGTCLSDVVDDCNVIVDCLVCVAGGLRVGRVLVVSFVGLLVKLGGFDLCFVHLVHSSRTCGCLGRSLRVIACLRGFVW